MDWLKDIATWPKIVYDTVTGKDTKSVYGVLGGLALGVYLGGTPAIQGVELTQIAKQYVVYGVCVTAGYNLIGVSVEQQSTH